MIIALFISIIALGWLAELILLGLLVWLVATIVLFISDAIDEAINGLFY